MGGIFPLCDTHGVPLDLIIDKLDQLGFICDWLDFHEHAIAKGWRTDRTISKLGEVVGDIYGSSWREEWEKRMRFRVAK